VIDRAFKLDSQRAGHRILWDEGRLKARPDPSEATSEASEASSGEALLIKPGSANYCVELTLARTRSGWVAVSDCPEFSKEALALPFDTSGRTVGGEALICIRSCALPFKDAV
jgi:hypothetical protein